jgi:hypothetical protein
MGEKLNDRVRMLETANTKPTKIKRRKRRISPKIIHAIELLASGKARTQSEAAAMASVTPEWLSKMLGRPEMGVLLEQTCRKYLRNGTVRATARLIELLDSASSRTALEASKHVLGISNISPPREGGVTINTTGGSGYVIQLGSRDAEVFEGEIGPAGGVLLGRRMTRRLVDQVNDKRFLSDPVSSSRL